MAVRVKNRNGKLVTLLNPSEKGKKFADELKIDRKMTNDGELKTNRRGETFQLTDEQRAYRAGYLAAQKDSAKAYNHNQNKKGKSRNSFYDYLDHELD